MPTMPCTDRWVWFRQYTRMCLPPHTCTATDDHTVPTHADTSTAIPGKQHNTTACSVPCPCLPPDSEAQVTSPADGRSQRSAKGRTAAPCCSTQWCRRSTGRVAVWGAAPANGCAGLASDPAPPHHPKLDPTTTKRGFSSRMGHKVVHAQHH